MPLIHLRPPRIALFLTVVALLAHWSFRHGDPGPFFLPGTGTAVGLAGFSIMMWAWLIFEHQKLAVCVTDITMHITKAGPYQYLRNPMYLGMFLMMLGLALLFGTAPFFLSALAFIAIMNYVFCPYEEKKLTNAFGSEYERYRKKVRRWL